MNQELNRSSDIQRLCESIGIDPRVYVRFNKAMGRPGRIEAKAVAGRISSPGVGKRAGGELDSKRPDTQAIPSLQSAGRGIPREFVEFPPAQSDQAAKAPALPRPLRTPPMQIALLSTAGGVGKTTLARVLARILGRRGYSVMLADHSPYNSMRNPFVSPGHATTEISFINSDRGAAPLPVVSRFNCGKELGNFESWLQFVSATSHFTFHDGYTDALASARELLPAGARVLVPVLPEPVSAMSAIHFHAALPVQPGARIGYILNRFDADREPHLRIRDLLAESLGDRLLPITIGEFPVAMPSASFHDAAETTERSLAQRDDLRAVADWLEAGRNKTDVSHHEEVEG